MRPEKRRRQQRQTAEADKRNRQKKPTETSDSKRRDKMNPICRECVLEKKLNGYPQDADPEKIRIYQEGVRKILDTDDFADTGTDAAWQRSPSCWSGCRLP